MSPRTLFLAIQHHYQPSLVIGYAHKYTHACTHTMDWLSMAPNTIGNLSLLCPVQSKDDCPPRGLVATSSLEKQLHNILKATAIVYTEQYSQATYLLYSFHCLQNIFLCWRENNGLFQKILRIHPCGGAKLRLQW